MSKQQSYYSLMRAFYMAGRNQKGCNNGNYRHGMADDKFNHVYNSMIKRCYKKYDSGYHKYGAKGVTVCKRWLGKLGFMNFKEDMLEQYLEHQKKNKTTQIDKDIGSEKLGIFPHIYSKETCCFLTNQENSKHRESSNRIKYEGKIYTVTDLSKILKIPRTSLGVFLKEGKTVQEIINHYKIKYARD